MILFMFFAQVSLAGASVFLFTFESSLYIKYINPLS